MLVGDVQVDVLDRDHWHSWPKHKDGWVALCPLPSTNAFQFQAQIPPDEPDEPSLARFQQIIDERTGMPAIRLHHATWLSLYRANVRMVDRYRVGRVFLAGDAAHVHSPAGGQGMNTGMQDAYNLGWKLSAVLSGAPASLLDTYEEERLPIAAWLLGATTKLHRQVFQSNADLHRDEQFLQLKLNYRGASLVPGRTFALNHPATRRPRARRPAAEPFGERSPPLRSFPGPPFHSPGIPPRAQKRPRTQYEPSVHRYEILRQANGPLREHQFIARDEHIWNIYGVASSVLFLIRPDGYIGLIANTESASQVKDYLRKCTRK